MNEEQLKARVKPGPDRIFFNGNISEPGKIAVIGMHSRAYQPVQGPDYWQALKDYFKDRSGGDGSGAKLDFTYRKLEPVITELTGSSEKGWKLFDSEVINLNVAYQPPKELDRSNWKRVNLTTTRAILDFCKPRFCLIHNMRARDALLERKYLVDAEPQKIAMRRPPDIRFGRLWDWPALVLIPRSYMYSMKVFRENRIFEKWKEFLKRQRPAVRRAHGCTRLPDAASSAALTRQLEADPTVRWSYSRRPIRSDI